SRLDRVLLFLGRGRARQQDVDVNFAKEVLGFFDVLAGRIFLNECGERATGLGQFPFLPQFRGGFKFRQTDVRARFGWNFTTLFFSDLDVLFENEVVTKPGRAAKDDHSQQQDKKPLHGWDSSNPAAVTGRLAGNFFLRLATGKEPMPEARYRGLLFVTPGKMTILAIKFLGKNPQREKYACHRRRDGLAR